MISVIIPTYNRAHLIEKSIESILCQTYKDIEIIIVDDGSTDNTAEVIKKLDSEKIKYISLEKNHGACFARNIGIKNASGQYIAFQDSDDIWHKNKLEKQLDFLKKYNYDFIFCGMTRIMLENPDKKYYFPNNDFDSSKNCFEQLLYINSVGTQTILCKKECFSKIMFDPNLKRFQDWDLALQAARYFKIGYLKESLVDSYVQVDSISKSKVANSRAWQDLYKKYEKDIKKNDRIYAKYLFRIANEVIDKDRKRAIKLYKESLKIKFSNNTLLMLILAEMGMTLFSNRLLIYQANRLFRK